MGYNWNDHPFKNMDAVDDIVASLQNNLRLFRLAAGYRAQDLADIIGIARDTYSRIETLKCNLRRQNAFAILLVLYAKAADGRHQSLKFMLDMLVKPDHYTQFDRIQARSRLKKILEEYAPRTGVAPLETRIEQELRR